MAARLPVARLPVDRLSVDRVTLVALLNTQEITISMTSFVEMMIPFKHPTAVAVKIGGFTYHLHTTTLGISAAHPIGVAVFVRESDNITTLLLEAECLIAAQEETLEALYTARISFPTASLY